MSTENTADSVDPQGAAETANRFRRCLHIERQRCRLADAEAIRDGDLAGAQAANGGAAKTVWHL